MAFLFWCLNLLLPARLEEAYLENSVRKDFYRLQNLVASRLIKEPEQAVTQFYKGVINYKNYISHKNVNGEKDFCLNLPVLMYHHIQPLSQAKAQSHAFLDVGNQYFEQQLAYLKAFDYQTLPAEKLVDFIRNLESIKTKAVILTFDDGYEDIYIYAFPLAKKYQVILNLMIPTGLVGSPGYLTWDQIKEMKDSGLVYIYNHTVSHYPLAVGNKEKIVSEVTEAQSQLEKHLGVSRKILAYPYGSFNNEVVAILGELGFEAAFSTNPGHQECQSNIYSLKRVRIGNASLDRYGF